ncbi:Protein-lysine N-methyltransferase EFM4 [Madurella mycetomatis]|uniref:Protein-lysine N-methyltransferase EFM4 n=1 Tax=Madurella mycetomatis TaxID=100816 RepID=A0A175VQZ6_9PEZI|nr:Protein-lysine N-methyltransferase EFM4 [Madurella mycetomatis]
MADTETTPAHLAPSELGTKEYWDKLYTAELSNHADNPADEGTVWFDDADAERKMVEFLEERASSPAALALDRETARVLDLGCGNGSLLFALRERAGWKGRLLGVDYSERSVQLARQVGAARGMGEVEFKVWDVLGGELADVAAEMSPSETAAAAQEGRGKGATKTAAATAAGPGWDLVLDKGTFDAVSLSGERDARGRRICEGYAERVLQLLRAGGIFLVTSCNWTEKELREWFEGGTVATQGVRLRLRLAGRIEYPSFSFGGVKGQTTSTLCFEKVAV